MASPSLLDKLIESAIEPDSGKDGSLSMVIINHLRQMKMFGIRKGLELYPTQDSSDKSRYQFISRVWKENRLSLYLPRIWDLFCAKGNILFLLRPNKKGSYDIRFFESDQYRTYYDSDGNMSEVVILYSYSVKTGMGKNYDPLSNKKWIKLVLTPTTETRYDFDHSPGLDIESVNSTFISPGQTYPNWLGFIPCVECNNNAAGLGQRGYSDFFPVKRQIESLEDDYQAINNNLDFFGGTTLVTSRSEGEIVEAIDTPSKLQVQSPHSGGASGWASTSTYSNVSMYPRYLNKQGNIGQKLKIKQVIGNVQGDERMAFLTPDPITPDHAQFLREKREAIHFALGGIDELGINASASAYEMKTIYGKVAATATTKAEALYDYGLCIIFQMALEIEERLFLTRMAEALKKPVEEVTPQLMSDLLMKNKLPNVPGLPPMTSTQVEWRWTGAVFEDSPRDYLDRSIVVRNLQEQGVNALDALTFLFPDKTDIEKESMLANGYPFRYVNSIVGTLGQIVQFYQGTLGIPNQEDPSMPLGAAININPLIEKGLNTINRELSYQKSYVPNSSPSPTSVLPPSINSSTSPNTVPGSTGSLLWAGFQPSNPEFTTWNIPPVNAPSNASSNAAGDGRQLSTSEPMELPNEGSTVSSSDYSILPRPSTIPAVYGEYEPLAQSIWGVPRDSQPTPNRTKRKPTNKRKP